MTINTAALLRRHPFFVGLAEDDLASVAKAMHPRRYASGQSMFSRGENSDGLYLIHDGLVRLSLFSADGREFTVRLAGSGEVIGEIAAIDDGPRSTDGQAVTATQVLVLAHDDFQGFVDTLPTLRRMVLKQLCARLRDTTVQLESFVLLPLESRLARLFLALARSSAAEHSGAITRVSLTIPQREIAALIGASRPRVNRLLVAWQEAEIVVRKGSIAHCRVAALEALMGSQGS